MQDLKITSYKTFQKFPKSHGSRKKSPQHSGETNFDCKLEYRNESGGGGVIYYYLNIKITIILNYLLLFKYQNYYRVIYLEMTTIENSLA